MQNKIEKIHNQPELQIKVERYFNQESKQSFEELLNIWLVEKVETLTNLRYDDTQVNVATSEMEVA